MKVSRSPLTAWKRVVRDYKRNARVRNLGFKLTQEEVISICTSECQYCGSAPKETKNFYNSALCTRRAQGGRTDTDLSYLIIKMNGIDRVSSDDGYTPDNCVPCCFQCNRAKNNISIEEFRQWASRLASRTGTY